MSATTAQATLRAHQQDTETSFFSCFFHDGRENSWKRDEADGLLTKSLRLNIGKKKAVQGISLSSIAGHPVLVAETFAAKRAQYYYEQIRTVCITFK